MPGKRKLTKEPNYEEKEEEDESAEQTPAATTVSFLDSLRSDDLDAGEELVGSVEVCSGEQELLHEYGDGDPDWYPEEDIEDLDNTTGRQYQDMEEEEEEEFYDDEEMKEEEEDEEFSEDEDDEAMDKDDVNVNFSELTIGEKAKHAVKSKPGGPAGGPRAKKFEYSDRLTEEFKLLMGEANLSVAKGDRKNAINICLEIIRNIPDSPAPYETLSVIYEEENDLYKSLQYGLISAHLWPQDPHKWYGLAQKCIELKDDENCKTCMSKALRYSHLTRDKFFIEDVIRYFVRSQTVGEEGSPTLPDEDAQKLAVGYRKLIKISSHEDTQDLLSIVQDFEIKCAGDLKKQEMWAKTYFYLVNTYPDLAQSEKITKVCKIHLSLKQYTRIPRLMVVAGYITERTPAPAPLHPQLGDMSTDLHDTVLGRVEEIRENAVTAVTAGPSLDSQFKVADEDLTPILRAALVASLIYKDHDTENTEELLSPLLTLLDPNVLSEELLLVADAYYNTNNYSAALPLYELMASSCLTEDSHTWTQLGQCHEEQGDWKEAVKCYERVLSFDDSNATAKLRLFSLQKTHLAENQEEFSVNIHADPSKIKEMSCRPDVVKLSFHRTKELVSEGHYNEALNEGYKILKTALFESIERCKSTSAKATGGGEFIRGQHTSLSSFNMLQHILTKKLGAGPRGLCEIYREMLTREEWYDWYLAMLACCLINNTDNNNNTSNNITNNNNNTNTTNRVQNAFILSLAAMSSRLIDYQPAIKNINVHCLYVAGVLNHADFLSENIGPLLYCSADTIGIWNLFYTIRHRLPQYRLHRLGVRWLFKNRSAFNGLFMNSMNSYYSRHYKAALAFYRQMLGQKPKDGKIYFYLSLFYLHFSCSKGVEFAQRRHEMVIQALACIFMYHQLRGSCQESLYNIGRCYHHLGLFQLALHYYNQALHTPPSIPRDAAPEHPDSKLEDVDMSHEIAYNMSHIYSACGSHHLSRQLFYKYAVV